MVLKKAKQGIYDIEDVKQFTLNYQQSGCGSSFSEYYHAEYGGMVINKALKQNITFANHNLVTDGIFTEPHLIVCRNVLIYFDRELQNRVLTLFRDSLVRDGFLCLGTKETLHFTDVEDDFRVVDERAKIYQKKVLSTE